MKIKLVKHEEADFTIDESKCEKISYGTLSMITDFKFDKEPESDDPKYVVFKTKEEFFENVNRYDVDTAKNVLINSKGNFFCALKGAASISAGKEGSDETGDTE